MWALNWFRAGTIGDIFIVKKGPFYGVKYLGESAKRIYYRRSKIVGIKYLGESASRVVYKAPIRVVIRYIENDKLNTRLLC